MPYYHLAGQNFYFPYALAELQSFEMINGAAETAVPFASASFPENEIPRLISSTEGWVGGASRVVEVHAAANGILLKVEGGGEFLITSHGETISSRNPQEKPSQLDCEIILGPAMVLALALRGVWSLHASAAMYKENVFIFLGESGTGKSTLAAYLSQSKKWRLVADDILPVKIQENKVVILPHFPQLKLPEHAQPCVNLPGHLPLKYICVLENAEPDQLPRLQKIATAQGVQALIGHVAGTRMFNPELLAKHMEFSTQAARQIPAYRVIYPHCRDTLLHLQEFLEKIC